MRSLSKQSVRSRRKSPLPFSHRRRLSCFMKDRQLNCSTLARMPMKTDPLCRYISGFKPREDTCEESITKSISVIRTVQLPNAYAPFFGNRLHESEDHTFRVESKGMTLR